MSQDDFQDESTEQQTYDTEENIAPYMLTWPRYIIIIGSIVLALVVTISAPAGLWPVVFMAYINCMLYAFFATKFLRKRTLSALIPVISPLWMVLGSCVGIIYFAIFFPNDGYVIEDGFVSYFAGGVRYQLVIFIFLLMYFVVLSWVLRKDQPGEQNPAANTKYIGYAAIATGIPILAMYPVSVTFGLPLFLQAWSFRLFFYYQSILFAAGVVFDRLSKSVKIILFGCLGIISFLYLLRDARGMALMPIASMFIGLFFFSSCSRKAKAAWLPGLLIFMIFFMLIGSTLRTLLGHGGALTYNLSTRWATLKDWKSAAAGKDAIKSVFSRLYYTAGNAVVAYTPSRHAYRNFSIAKYAKEFVLYMIPEPILRRIIPLEPGKLYKVLGTELSSPFVLLDYGIWISEQTSVETSTIGHFWMLGGYWYVVCGGVMVALLHSIIIYVIRHAWNSDPDKGVFYFAVLINQIIGTMNSDFILLARLTLIPLFFAFIGYKLIKPFISRFNTTTFDSEFEGQQLQEYAHKYTD